MPHCYEEKHWKDDCPILPERGRPFTSKMAVLDD
jgi:hypothetical protein